MSKTLDEWIEENYAAEAFKDALKTHVEVFATRWKEEEKKTFIRLIMISFRNAALDFGARE